MALNVGEAPPGSQDFEDQSLDLSPETQARFLSRDTGIPYADALMAARDSGPIGDYVERYWTSREVGAVWVTYDGGYRVHVREIQGQDAGVAADLSRKLSSTAPLVHHGGASLGELNAASKFLQDKFGHIPYNLNVQEGYVDLLSETPLPADVIDPAWVRVVKELPVRGGELVVIHPGLDWVNSNNPEDWCTPGFAWKVPNGIEGVSTAAHCWDVSRTAKDEYGGVHGSSLSATNVFETCLTMDIQHQRTTGGIGWFGRDQLNHSWASIYTIAGGYYIGQQSVTFGGTTGGLWDTVLGFGNYVRPVGADCPATGTVHGLWVGQDIRPGDSGAPITLVYNSRLYLAATISFAYVGVWGVGAWTPWVTIPAGAYICVETNPC